MEAISNPPIEAETPITIISTENETENKIIPIAPKEFNWSNVPIRWSDKYGKTNLAKFHHYLEKLECLDYFITWNYNYAISSCLGRKVWLGQERDFPIFPNLYLFFVGPPGASKSLPATKTTKILSNLIDIKEKNGKFYDRYLVNISPDSATLEALYDKMAEATEGIRIQEKPPIIYVHSSVSFCLAEEVGVLFREKTNDLIMFLTAGWNCGDFRRKIKSEKEIKIVNMCINFLGCCTPKWYRDTMSSKLINEGFTGRVLHIYGSKKRWHSKSLDVTVEQQTSLKSLTEDHLKKLAKVVGEVKFTPEAQDYIDDWCINIYPKERSNKDSKLDFYFERKRHHLKKLCIVAHFHNKLDLIIDIDDVKLAQTMLLEIEPNMHHALQHEVTNKLSKISDSILSFLLINGDATQHTIIRKHFYMGETEEIMKALDFLKDSGDIFPVSMDNGKPGYSVIEEEEQI